MKRLSQCPQAVVGFALLLLLPSLGLAQAQQTFVSALRGLDTNPCTVAAPCRSFNRAIVQVTPGGQVVAIDSGDYSSFTTGKAVTVQAADGIYAGVTAPAAGNTISVNAGPSEVVTLRGLTVAGSSAIGINFTTGKALHVERCRVEGPAVGIYSLGSGDLYVRDTTVSGSSGHGIIFFPVSNSATATVDHCRLTGNGGIGLIVVRGLATAHDSVFSENDTGAGVSSAYLGTAELNMESCVSTNNGDGILVTNPEATLRLSNTTVTDNADFGIEQQNGSTALSRGNNTIEGNRRDINGTLGTYSPK